MDWLTIEGIPPWDGRYELDLDGAQLTTREWGWIKRLSGYLPLTIDAAFRGADPELYAALAVIALRRAGRIQPADVADVFDRIADAPFGAAIGVESDDAGEADAGGNPTPAASAANGNTSGTGSSASSDPSAATLPASGMPASAISELAPTRLES